MTTYKLIVNPAARRGRSAAVIRHAVELFRAKAAAVDVEYTRGPGDATGIALRARDNFDVIVAVGGDGTVHEVASGMLFSQKPLAVVPCGSGNDFAKVLNLPSGVEGAVDVALAGRTKLVDAGRINDACFINGVGIGFDAAVTRESRAIRRLTGLPLYLWAMIRALGKYRPVRMKITMNDDVIDQETFMLTIGNGTTCGGGFVLTPRAKIDDGVLDVTIVKPLGLISLLLALPHVFKGTIEKISCATMLRATRLLVECAAPAPVHVDGELFSETGTRFELEVVPAALTVIGNF